MRKKIICSIVTGMLLLLAGCGSEGYSDYGSKSYAVNDAAAYEESWQTEADMSYEDAWGTGAEAPAEAKDSASTNPVATNRKLIKNASLRVETKQFDALLNDLETQINTLGGYVENMNLSNGYSYSGYREATRVADLTVRMPKDRLDGFLKGISEVCNVVSRSENVEDVTLSYVDLESHKKALEVEQDRLFAFLEQAQTIEDMLTIESRLSDIRYRLESMESQLRTYDNLIDYSTVQLHIDEVAVLTPVEEKSFGERLGDGFLHSLETVGNGLKEFVAGLIIFSPYILLVGIVIAIVIIIIVVAVKKANKAAQSSRLPNAQIPVSGQAVPMQSIPQNQFVDDKTNHNTQA